MFRIYTLYNTVKFRSLSSHILSESYELTTVQCLVSQIYLPSWCPVLVAYFQSGMICMSFIASTATRVKKK